MCRASKSKDDQAGQDFALPRLIRRYSRRNRMSLPFQRPTDHRRATQYKGGRLVNCPTIHGDSLLYGTELPFVSLQLHLLFSDFAVFLCHSPRLS